MNKKAVAGHIQLYPTFADAQKNFSKLPNNTLDGQPFAGGAVILTISVNTLYPFHVGFGKVNNKI